MGGRPVPAFRPDGPAVPYGRPGTRGTCPPPPILPWDNRRTGCPQSLGQPYDCPQVSPREASSGIAFDPEIRSGKTRDPLGRPVYQGIPYDYGRVGWVAERAGPVPRPGSAWPYFEGSGMPSLDTIRREWPHLVVLPWFSGQARWWEKGRLRLRLSRLFVPSPEVSCGKCRVRGRQDERRSRRPVPVPARSGRGCRF